MKNKKHFSLLTFHSLLKIASAAVIVFCALSSKAQSSMVPKDYAFETKEDYKKYEPNILRCCDWMLTTPLDKNPDTRVQVSLFLIQWVAGSPDITMSLAKNFSKLVDKNSALLMIYMAAYSKYAIENKGCTERDAKMTAIKSIISFYKKGIAITKDKDLDKLIAAEKSGTLEEWVIKNKY